MRGLVKFAVAMLISCLPNMVMAQTDMERAAADAVREGDYEQAVNQLRAHYAYLVTTGVDENAPEVLKLSKRIRHLEDCRTLAVRARQRYDTLQTEIEWYNRRIAKLSLEGRQREEFLDLRQKKSELADLAGQVRAEYSEIVSKSSAESYTDIQSGKCATAAVAAVDALVSPDAVLENLFVRNPSDRALDNYIAILGEGGADAVRVRQDYEAWRSCMHHSDTTLCDDYLNNGHRMFRDDVKKRKITIIDEQYRIEDENLWRATDRTSKNSLLKYLTASTGNHKQYGELAKKMYLAIEQAERTSEEEQRRWDMLDKDDEYQLKAYLKSTPSSAYRNEVLSRLENLSWKKTDTSSIKSLLDFMDEWPDSQYKNEVNAHLALIGGRYKMSVSKYQEAYVKYQEAAKYLKFNQEDAANYKMLASLEEKTLCEEEEKTLCAEKEKIAREEAERQKEEREQERLRKARIRKEYGCGFQLSGGLSSVAYLTGDGEAGFGFGCNAGFKIGRNCSLFNFLAGCELCYMYGQSKNVFDDFAGVGLGPYALARFNSASKNRYMAVGGGYRFGSGMFYGQLSYGWNPKKWFDTDLFFRVGKSQSGELYSLGLQLSFNVF